MTMTVPHSDAIAADAYFPALRDHVISATGLEFYTERPEALAGHLTCRIKQRGLSDCFSYLRLLQDEHAGEAELDRLIALLTIGETYFFRHRELFDALRDTAFPEILCRNQATKRLRVWSAGSSTGAEAYTLSILLQRDLEELFSGWTVSILGTDINRSFLAQAAEGRYEEWAFRGTSPELRSECFEQQGKSWRIAPRFRKGVTFQYHNLVRHPFPSLVNNLLAFDLILCRNVLIYFAPEIVHRITAQLAECLVPGGWLAVGHAEHGSHLDRAFEYVNCCGATLYRKLDPRTERTTAIPRRWPDPVDRPASVPGASCSAPFPPKPKRAAWDGGQRPANHVGPLPAPCRQQPSAIKPCPKVDQVRTLADGGNVDGALQLCESLIAENSLNPVYYFYRALLLEQTAGHEAAVEALNKAIYLDREFELAHYYLGLTQQAVGDLSGAVKSFRNVLKLLEGRDQDEHLSDAEGISVADLEELTRMHIKTMEEA